jgi:hypothetical protein
VPRREHPRRAHRAAARAGDEVRLTSCPLCRGSLCRSAIATNASLLHPHVLSWTRRVWRREVPCRCRQTVFTLSLFLLPRCSADHDRRDADLVALYQAFLRPHRQWLTSLGVRRVTFVTPNDKQAALLREYQGGGVVAASRPQSPAADGKARTPDATVVEAVAVPLKLFRSRASSQPTEQVSVCTCVGVCAALPLLTRRAELDAVVWSCVVLVDTAACRSLADSVAGADVSIHSHLPVIHWLRGGQHRAPHRADACRPPGAAAAVELLHSPRANSEPRRSRVRGNAETRGGGHHGGHSLYVACGIVVYVVPWRSHVWSMARFAFCSPEAAGRHRPDAKAVLCACDRAAD